VDAALELGILQRRGTWYFHGEDRIGQGKENVVKLVEENPKFLDKFDKIVREKLATFEGPIGSPGNGGSDEEESVAMGDDE
jgi:recombination protein RecA